MQAVELFAVWVFASCIGSLRCGFFCNGVGVPKRYWFLAVRFVLSSGGFSTGAVVLSCTQLGLFCW